MGHSIRTSACRFLILGLLATTLDVGCKPGDQSESNAPAQWDGATIFVGIDGLRWDYPERFDMDALRELADEGASAGSLVPVFPTKTFPNFYSLATGLFPNKTGIVDNTMYDPEFDARFRMGDTTAVRDGRWWGGEPVWVTAEKQGKHAAVFFWPGSEAEIAGARPSYVKAFDQSIPNRDRVEQVLDWLSMTPAKRPHLILVYFELVDVSAHRHGPDAEETRDAVREADSLIGMLRSGLVNLGLTDAVNIVVVSDHGLSLQSADKVIFLDDYVDIERAGILSLGQHVTLWPKPEAVDSVYLALAGAHPELKVYKRDELPPRFHLAGHRRTPPLIAVPSGGWSVSTRRSAERRRSRSGGGAHGYDNLNPDMHGVFVAAGPAFRSGVRVDSIRAVDVYNLVSRSLGLQPAPNDGDETIIPRLMTQP